MIQKLVIAFITTLVWYTPRGRGGDLSIVLRWKSHHDNTTVEHETITALDF